MSCAEWLNRGSTKTHPINHIADTLLVALDTVPAFSNESAERSRTPAISHTRTHFINTINL